MDRNDEVMNSVKEGASNFLDDAARLKDSFEDVSADRKDAKAAKKADRKAKFESAIAELRESFEQGAEKSEADGNALMEGLKGIAADAGIDIKEDNAVAKAFKALKESFEQGFEAMESDAAITKGAIDDLSDERKAKKADKKAARSQKFDDAVDAMKKSLE